MSKSLKDQLLDLKLVSKLARHKRAQADKPMANAGKARAGNTKTVKVNVGNADISLHQAYRMREQQDRQKKEQAATLKREQQRLRRETNQKIRKRVDAFAIRDTNADNKRDFLFKGRLRSVLATPEQIRAINSATLGIVYLSGSYHLLPIEKVAEIRQFAPEHAPELQAGEIQDQDEQEHPVPDDLIW